jgi:hypothetical protein
VAASLFDFCYGEENKKSNLYVIVIDTFFGDANVLVKAL